MLGMALGEGVQEQRGESEEELSVGSAFGLKLSCR